MIIYCVNFNELNDIQATTHEVNRNTFNPEDRVIKIM